MALELQTQRLRSNRVWRGPVIWSLSVHGYLRYNVTLAVLWLTLLRSGKSRKAGAGCRSHRLSWRMCGNNMLCLNEKSFNIHDSETLSEPSERAELRTGAHGRCCLE